MWNNPEEGHMERPPSGAHCSVCSCSPGELHQVLEIYGQSCGSTPPACTNFAFNAAQKQAGICLSSNSTVTECLKN